MLLSQLGASAICTLRNDGKPEPCIGNALFSIQERADHIRHPIEIQDVKAWQLVTAATQINPALSTMLCENTRALSSTRALYILPVVNHPADADISKVRVGMRS